ncbi:MAG TPA: KH domain-containing protein [Anaerolineales bacterium]|nr:KH domain-containing protein [Anaerolineales bacterium]
MKELVEYIAKSLVDDPTEVRVVVKQDRREIRVELKVAEQDMGRIIGRNGRVANAIRALMRAAAARRGERTSLDIL